VPLTLAQADAKCRGRITLDEDGNTIPLAANPERFANCIRNHLPRTTETFIPVGPGFTGTGPGTFRPVPGGFIRIGPVPKITRRTAPAGRAEGARRVVALRKEMRPKVPAMPPGLRKLVTCLEKCL